MSKKNSLSTSWVMMDIQSWWPGGNPRLTRDRPISLFSTQARTKIQSPPKNFDWQYSFATMNHLQLTTIIIWKKTNYGHLLFFYIATPCFVFGVLWGPRWGLRRDWSDWESFGIPHPPTAPPRLSLENLDPSKILPAILGIPLSRANKWILDPRPPPPLTSENNFS